MLHTLSEIYTPYHVRMTNNNSASTDLLKQLIGNTPMVEIPFKTNRLHLKLEGANPGLSIKDRVAFHICHELEKRIGLRGKKVVEYSSGNLGVGLAIASKIYGFNLTLIVTTKTSADKIKLLRHYGVELIMVDNSIHSEKPLGLRGFAKVIAQTRESIFIDQFNNPLNPETHVETTGPEIHRDVPLAEYIFSAMGTGGTATGVAQYFKNKGLPTKVIGVTPNSGIYYSVFHKLPKKRSELDTVIEGVGEDFLPKNLNMDILAHVAEIKDTLALLEVERLISDTGIHVGGSSGMAIAAAKQYINENELHGKNVVVICPDSGNRYLSAVTPAKGASKSEYAEVVEAHRKNGMPKIL